MDEFERETSEYFNGYDQYLTTQTTLKAKTIASHKGKARLFALDYLARREGEMLNKECIVLECFILVSIFENV